MEEKAPLEPSAQPTRGTWNCFSVAIILISFKQYNLFGSWPLRKQNEEKKHWKRPMHKNQSFKNVRTFLDAGINQRKCHFSQASRAL